MRSPRVQVLGPLLDRLCRSRNVHTYVDADIDMSGVGRNRGFDKANFDAFGWFSKRKDGGRARAYLPVKVGCDDHFVRSR